MNDRDQDSTPPVATASQTVGPFFHFGLAADDALGRVAPPDADGEHIRLRVRVIDGDGVPLPDALVELYQADASGMYGRSSFAGFGRLATGEDGVAVFDTIRPGAVADGRGNPQAPHINVCLFARGLLRHLYTRIYFTGDPALATDPILSLVPPDRRETLLATRGESGPPRAESKTAGPGDAGPTWDFVIRLVGAGETVFFDI